MASNLNNPAFQKAEHLTEKEFLGKRPNFIKKKENRHEKRDHVVDNAADSSMGHLLDDKGDN